MMYLIFAFVVFLAIILDHWLDGEDIHRIDAFVFAGMALFPVMNVLCLVIAVCKIFYRLLPDPIFKGRK